MDFTFEIVEDAVVLIPEGNLVASEKEFFRSHVEKLVAKKYRYMLLDLSRIDFMDSCGLDSVMAINKSATDGGGYFACAAPKESVQKIFRITWADQKIAIAPTVSVGLQMLQEFHADRIARNSIDSTR